MSCMCSNAYLRPETFMMKLFCKNRKRLKAVNYFPKRFPKCAWRTKQSYRGVLQWSSPEIFRELSRKHHDRAPSFFLKKVHIKGCLGFFKFFITATKHLWIIFVLCRKHFSKLKSVTI